MKNMHQHQHHSSVSEFSLFVGDLPYDCGDEKLQRLFQQKFKSVKRVQIIRNEDGSSRGFGFIRFEDRSEFQAALSLDMKIGNTTLRLDTAHLRDNRGGFKNRSRYNSFNSTGNNNSNHHNHHFNSNNHHHHHNPHGGQHQNPNNNNNNNNNNKSLQQTESGIGGNHQQPPPPSSLPPQQHSTQPVVGGSNNNLHHTIGVLSSGSSSSSIGHHHHSVHHQQQHSHHNTHSNHSHYNNPTQQHQQHSSNQLQPAPDNNKNLPKQPAQIGGVESGSQQQAQPQPSQQQQPLSQPPAQHNLQQQVTSNSTSTTNSNNSANHSGAMPNNHNLNTNQQAIGPDLRGYTAAATMMDSHVLSTTDQPSMMTPTSVYGHLYPYGPPPFGYMPPPPHPQANPVIPISAVPPAPPNQASPSAGVSQQHGHSLSASNTTRYNSGQHHHHQQQHQTHATDGGINTMAGGMQAPHQGPPLYYYYHPSPLYFDQAGGAAAPPSIYHTQPFPPQFFAMPNPAYIPNAHTFNQHQQQPPTASQSDAPVINQQQPHQHQVNMRTRDIDTTIE